MRRRVVTVLLAILALAMVVLAIRSWTVDDRDRASAAVQRFGSAVAAKDYPTICQSLLSRRLHQSLEAVGLPCEQALRMGLGDVRDPRLEVESVVVVDDRARVAVHSTAQGQKPSEDMIDLRKESGAWRIASLGGGSTARPAVPGSTAPAPATRTTPVPPPGGKAPGGLVLPDPKARHAPAAKRHGSTAEAVRSSVAEARRNARRRELQRRAREIQGTRGG